MGQRHVPGWLYEVLPYCYMTSGALVLIFLRSIPGAISGFLLVSAGFVIWSQRKYYRAKVQREIERNQKSSKSPSLSAPTESLEIAWQPAYEVGNEAIDRQHRRLFALGNEMIKALMSNEPKANIVIAIDEMISDIANHFATEENVMESHGVPLSEAHKASHANLVDRIREMQIRFSRDQLPAGELIGFITYDVIAQHIAKEDLNIPSKE